MPGMNGLELLRRIRTGQTPRPKDSRFIILTSFSNTEALGAAMSLDVNGFLVKPIRIGVVMEKIERAIQENFQLRARRKTMNQWLLFAKFGRSAAAGRRGHGGAHAGC
jgi:YesN/AraC family two-component response regulator